MRCIEAVEMNCRLYFIVTHVTDAGRFLQGIHIFCTETRKRYDRFDFILPLAFGKRRPILIYIRE